MQMNLFYVDVEMPRKSAVRVIRKPIHTHSAESAAMLIDRPAPTVPIHPRHVETTPCSTRQDEDPERWDGLY